VKGEVKVKSFTQIPEDVFAYGPLRSAQGEIVLTPTSWRLVKGGFAVLCPEVDTPEQAKALSGTELYVDRAELPEPDEDEYYFEDLIGLEVKTTDGKRMGRVLAVHDYGAGTMLEISGGTDKKGHDLGAFFHSFSKKSVPVVDLAAKRVVILTEEAIIAKKD
jgi:16S rRNA processing protein RimM